MQHRDTLKEPALASKLTADSDWYDQEITLADARGFQVGDGVCLRGRNPHHGGMTVLKRTLVARSGNRFKLDRALRENFWQKVLRETRQPLARVGIRLGAATRDIRLTENQIQGFATAIADLRKP